MLDKELVTLSFSSTKLFPHLDYGISDATFTITLSVVIIVETAWAFISFVLLDSMYSWWYVTFQRWSSTAQRCYHMWVNSQLGLSSCQRHCLRQMHCVVHVLMALKLNGTNLQRSAIVRWVGVAVLCRLLCDYLSPFFLCRMLTRIYVWQEFMYVQF